MKQIIIGVLVFLVWLSISTYWYVCGIRNLCEQPKKQQVVVLLPQEEAAPIKQPEPKPEPKPEPAPKVEEKKELILPVVYFIFDRDSIKNVDDLIASSRTASNYLKANADTKLYITGHACNVNESESAYQLGLMRANTVRKYMVMQGVPDSRILAISKGDDEPRAANDTQEETMLNRRVEMVIK